MNTIRSFFQRIENASRSITSISNQLGSKIETTARTLHLDIFSRIAANTLNSIYAFASSNIPGDKSTANKAQEVFEMTYQGE